MDKDTNSPDVRRNVSMEDQEGNKQRPTTHSKGGTRASSEKITDLVKNLIEAIKDLPLRHRFSAFFSVAFIVLTLIIIPLVNNKTGINPYWLLIIFLLGVVSIILVTTWKPKNVSRRKQKELSSFQLQQTQEDLKQFVRDYDKLISSPTRFKRVKTAIPIAQFLPNDDGQDEKDLVSKLVRSREDGTELVNAQNLLEQAIYVGFLSRRNGKIFIGDRWNKVRIKAIWIVVQEGAKVESKGWPIIAPTGKYWWDPDWDEILIHITHIAGSRINKKIFLYLSDPMKKKPAQYRASLQLLRRIIKSGAPVDPKVAIELVKVVLDQLIDLLPKI